MPSMTAQSCPQTLPCLTSTVILTKDIIEFIFPVRALRPRETEDLPESWGWKTQSQIPAQAQPQSSSSYPWYQSILETAKAQITKRVNLSLNLKKKTKKNTGMPHLSGRQSCDDLSLSGPRHNGKASVRATDLERKKTPWCPRSGLMTNSILQNNGEKVSWKSRAGRTIYPHPREAVRHQGTAPQTVKPKGCQPHMWLVRYLYSFLF